MNYSLKYKYISPEILEICWPAEIHKNILLEMMAMKKVILSRWQDELWDITIGYHCLSLYFKDPYSLQEVNGELETMYQQDQNLSLVKRKRWKIPVLYKGKDLERVSMLTGLPSKDIIALHQKPSYLLYFYGFMPGFMYLGGLSDRLFAARKDKPDPKIPKGSVAIGGKQTGIYPMDSPGGWNVIGNTPVTLFELHQQPPVKAQPGDEICFQEISESDFRTILNAVKKNSYSLKYEEL